MTLEKQRTVVLKEVAPGTGQRTGGDPPDVNGSSLIQTGVAGTRLTLDEVLDILGWRDEEYTAVCHRFAGGRFQSSVVESVEASTQVKLLPETACNWFSVNPTSGPERHNQGRGREREVTRWAALCLDLDVKPGAFGDMDKARAFVNVLSELIGTRPSLVIYSGHGLQPLWPVEDCKLDDEVKWARAYQLSRRFGRLAANVAVNHSGAVLDNVSDLTRVLRVPGTTNWKDLTNPVQVFALSDSGGPLTIDQVEDFLDEWTPRIDSDKPVGGEIMSPPDDWEFGRATCPYVGTMVDSWSLESDRPGVGRHNWAMTRCVRLAAAHRLGCIAEDDLVSALQALEAALTYWCQKVGAPRPLAPDEVGSAFRWAQAKVATFDDERTWQELPQHDPHPGPPQDDGSDHEQFWDLTATLGHIRDFARARRVSPWAMLGVTLAQLLTTIPPSVQIPPLVGGRASLNLFVGLVGNSGRGKGAPERAARDAFRLKPIYTTGIGSGEGINHLFAHFDKKAGETVMDRQCVLFSVPEIDMLAALSQRNASTLLPQLRKAWSGEPLSFAYAAKDKAVVVEEHSYRLNLIAGIQPRRAGALLDDADGGTPQRFVWLPCVDRDAPDERPPEPEPIDLTGIANGWPADFGVNLAGRRGPHDVALPPEVTELVDRSRLAALRDEPATSALDGHALLCRIKVAVALALLHNAREVTHAFWDMSGTVMAVSDSTRASVETELAERAERVNRARGRAEGVRAVEADVIREDEAIKRVVRTLVRRLQKVKGSVTWSGLREAVAHRDRCYFEDAVDTLAAAGQIEILDGERGRIVRLLES